MIEAEFAAAVERCEFNQIVGEEGEVDVETVSRRAADRLAELGLLA